MNFTPSSEQEQILRHNPSRHGRILAGPGTGKSATVVALIERLLARSEAPKIKLLTFTRAATAELAKKVAEYPGAFVELPSTIHSFAISILLRNPGCAEFPEPLRLADDWEQNKIVYPTLARRIGVRKDHLENLFRELAAKWESLVPEQHPKVDLEERARFLGGWQEHREVFGYTLLSELPDALRCALRDHRDLEGVDYDLLIVDEYQDLNACDLEVLRRVAELGFSVVAAGDDDQSIYSFRRAAPEGIRSFLEDYPAAQDYSLSITHRCGRRIIEWANFVIEGDPDRPRKPRLEPSPGSPDGEVALLAFRGHASEARGIARLVRWLIDEEDVPAAEILVLLRSDRHGAFSKPIKDAFDETGIPYSDPDRVKRVLAEETNRRLIALARLLVNRSDSIAWTTLFELQRGIGNAFVDVIYQAARANGRQFGPQLLDAWQGEFKQGPRASSNRASELITETESLLDTIETPDAPEESWGNWLTALGAQHPKSAPSDEMQAVLEAVDTLLEPEAPLSTYLNKIAPLAKDYALTTSESVRIMTMAMSKGLTVQAAIVAGLDHALIPRLDCDLAEERRLLYVAMTRAKRFVFGTWAGYRQGPQARAGRAQVGQWRTHTQFLRGGPVESKNGEDYVEQLSRSA